MIENKLGFFKRVGLAFKGIFSGTGGSGSTSWFGWSTGSFLNNLFSRSNIDFEQEVGDVTKNSLVMAAVRWVGNTLPEARLIVTKPGKSGKQEEIPNHGLVRLFMRPNDYYSGSTLLKCFALSWIVDGNVFFLKVRNNAGKVVALHYLPHWLVEPRWTPDGSEFISYYVYKVDGREQRFEATEIVHISDGMDVLTRRGMSPLRSVLRELFSDNEAANFSSALLLNSGIPPYIITSKDGVDIDADGLKEAIKRQTTGDNRGDPIVASGGIEVKQLSFDPQSLDLKQLRRLPEERVAAVLGIPGIVLGFGSSLDRSTYSNYQQGKEAAYESYIIPLLRHIEDELTHQLLEDFETDQTAVVSHDLSQVRVLQDDQNELYKRLDTGVRGGWIKRSEARQQVGLEVNAEDDVYLDQQPAVSEPAPATAKAATRF